MLTAQEAGTLAARVRITMDREAASAGTARDQEEFPKQIEAVELAVRSAVDKGKLTAELVVPWDMVVSVVAEIKRLGYSLHRTMDLRGSKVYRIWWDSDRSYAYVADGAVATAAEAYTSVDTDCE